MNQRTKKQHFIPRFYLDYFTDQSGDLCTYDATTNTQRKSKPTSTAYEVNIYTPIGEDGKHIDYLEGELAKIETVASQILPDLIARKKLSDEAKLNFSVFLATMFTRSPVQLRQFASAIGSMTFWQAEHVLNSELQQKKHKGNLTQTDLNTLELIKNKPKLKMEVDRKVGLTAFQQVPSLAAIISKMTWTFEISENQQIITSDNPFFWISAGPEKVNPNYGFGLAHPQAVIPFPICPNLILRIDWDNSNHWKSLRLDKNKAKLANKYQAKHKDRFLYFRDYDDGICRLGLKYKSPINQINMGIQSPEIQVVRKLGK